MGTLDDENVRDLLFGDTDPREVALFLAQQSLSMDAVERDQRLTILTALNIYTTGQMASASARMAKWTMVLAMATILLAIATPIVAVCSS
jgi:hypothetical protein